jgi:hypothetical protein
MTKEGGAVGWAETSGTNNRTPEGTPTYVKAICNDLTITAPNRQPITCSAQFTVIPGTATASGGGGGTVNSGPVLRGEFLRLFLGNSVIGKATNVSLHVSLSMEDATTKDDTSASSNNLDYKAQAPTQINYDISSDCLYDGGLDNLVEGQIYEWDLSDASGEGQATKGSELAWGSAMLTSLVANAPVNQNITYSATFTGVGLLNETSSTNSTGD